MSSTTENPTIGIKAASKTGTKTPVDPAHELPEKPLVVIEPARGRIPIDLKDLWHYRDLFQILTMRDIKVRYKQTLLGAAWAIIQPLFTMLIFTLFFGRLAGMPLDGIPYPIFAFAGLLPWIFFSNAVTNSGNSLVGSSNLITKVIYCQWRKRPFSVGIVVGMYAPNVRYHRYFRQTPLTCLEK